MNLPMVGVLRKQGRFLAAEPLFGPGGEKVTLDDRRGSVGDLVLVGASKRGARVLRTLGKPWVARDVLEGLMLDRGLRRSFPRKALAEAAEVEPPLDEVARADLRDLATFTIDPEDARDFDDAISAERHDGFVRLWVHIADVSAYVRPGGAIDREAERRATSVYVPGAVEPMLPEALSDGACSLRPGEDKLAVSVEIDIAHTDVRRVSFHRALIRSDARLTYGQVDEVFAGRARAHEPWGGPLEIAREVSRALRGRREQRGSLEVNTLEPSFEWDDDGHVTGVSYEQATESHTLIEELMILANEQVAGHLAERRLPSLYRVHERPDPQSVELMIARLASLDIPTPALPQRMSPQQAADVAAEASRMAAAFVRSTGRGRFSFGSLVLRSLKQAYYTPRNLGHAGLASAHYTHFTSPIRRYPDLVVHRALLSSIGLDATGPKAGELEEAGVEASAREREAMKIERSADDVCLAFLLERVLAERNAKHPASVPNPSGGDEPLALEGEIVGLVGKGAFIRFGEQGFEGFLGARSLHDWYELNEEGTALIGRESSRALRIGDPITVAVDRVDAPRGRVDLVPAGAAR